MFNATSFVSQLHTEAAAPDNQTILVICSPWCTVSLHLYVHFIPRRMKYSRALSSHAIGGFTVHTYAVVLGQHVNNTFDEVKEKQIPP